MPFEATFVTDPANAPALHADALLAAKSVTESGATRSNAAWDETKAGTLSVEGQRVALLLIQGGCAGNDPHLIDLGLKAIEWAIQPSIMGAGDWPDERLGEPGAHANNTHPRSVFMAAAARGLVTILQSPLAIFPDLRKRVNACKAGLVKAAQWMMASEDLADFLSTKTNMNQRLFVAVSLHFPGLWGKSNGAAMIIKAANIVTDATTRMLPDGTLPEAGGFDVSYQSVSIELLSAWIGSRQDNGKSVPLSAVDMLRRATARWQDAWTPDGKALPQGSRTTVTRYVPGPGPKGQAIDGYGQRARLANYILHKPGLAEFAAALDLSGPDFEHVAKAAT